MEILRTSLTKENLKQIPTIEIVEETQNSEFFNIYDIPNFDLGSGNHSFLIYGSDYLVGGTEIVIEMLDTDGQVIKTEAHEDSVNAPAWRVSFEITPQHTNGLAELNIAGTAYLSEDDKWQQRNKSHTNKNVLWTKKLAVNTTLVNRSDIIFLEEPDFEVSFEQVSFDYKPKKFRSYAKIDFNDLETISGKVETVELYYRLNGLEVSGSGDESKWKLLSKIPVSASNGINVNSLSYRTEMPATDYGEVYDFKARYLNPMDSYAKSDGEQVKETILEDVEQNRIYLYLEEGLITGSLYAGNTINKGIEFSGMNSAYIRNVDYPGWDDAVATNTFGFLMFSGSVFPTSSNNYSGVGLELFGGQDAYLRFLTDPSLLEIATQTFYLGSDAQYISGSSGNIEISSSNFWLKPDGSVIISGSISASAGNIGGWGITDEYLISEDDRIRLYGSGIISASNFYVSEGGNLTASNVLLDGNITASGGYFSASTIEYISGSELYFEQGTINTFTASDSYLQTVSGSDLYFENGTIDTFSASNSYLQTVSGSELYFENGVIDTFTASNSVIENISGSDLFFEQGTIDTFTASNSYLQTVSGSDLYFEQGSIDTFTASNSYLQTVSGSDLYFSNGTFDGKIVADVGEIGGWTISENSLSASNIMLSSLGIMQTKDYASGFGGWQIDQTGRAEFNEIIARGKITTAVFEKQEVNAVGGQLYIANSTILSSSVGASDTNLYVDNVTGFNDNEFIKIKYFSGSGTYYTEDMLITGSQRITPTSDTDFTGILHVERYKEHDGVNQDYTYPKGNVIVSTGVVGSGYIVNNANYDEDTPYIDFYERTGSAYNDIELKARIGDLYGLRNTDAVYSSPDPKFGLMATNVFLQGVIQAKSGSIADMSGENLNFTNISSSNFYSENGFITNASGSDLHFTNGTFDGKLQSETGEIGGWIIGATTLKGANITMDSADSRIYKTDDNNDNTGYYLDFTPNQGYYVRFGTNFAVSSSGQLIASGAVIEGVMTASAGYIGGWKIESDRLITDGSPYFVFVSNEDENLAISAGATSYHNSGSAPFVVRHNGEVTASNILLRNDITASGAYFSSSYMLESTIKTISGSDLYFEQGTIDTFTASNSYLQTVSGSELYFDDGTINNFTASNSSLEYVSGSNLHFTNGTFDGKIVANIGDIAGWEINSTQIFKDPIYIDSDYQGVYIEDVLNNKIVEMANQSMQEITGSENILLNNSFEDGSSGQDVSIPNWAYSVDGNLEKYVSASIWGQDIVVHGNKSVAFVAPQGVNIGDYRLYQDLTGSFLANESVYAVLFGKVYYGDEIVGDLQEDAARENLTQSVAMYYSSSAVADWERFYPSDSSYAPFYLGKEFVEYSHFGKLPEDADFVRIEISGSINEDPTFAPDSRTFVTYDYFHASIETPKIQLLPDGILIYASPKAYIKATADGLDIKGGNTFDVNSINAGNIDIGGLLASKGAFQGTTIPPYESDPLDVGTDAQPGNVLNYSRGNHVHNLPFDTVNTVLGTGTITDLYVDNLHASGSIVLSGSNLEISGSLFVDEQIYAPSLNTGVDNSVLILDSDGYIKTDEINSRVWGSSLVDYSGTPTDNQIAIFSDTDTVEGDSNFTWDGERFTISDSTGSLFEVSTNSEDEYISIDRIGTLRISSDDYPSIILQHTPLDYPFEIKALDNRLAIFNGELQLAEFNQDGTFILGNTYYSSSLGEGRVIFENSLSIGTDNIDNALNISGSISASGQINIPNIGTDTDNSVVILNSSGYLKTDEIDSRVWGSTLVDGSGESNKLAYWSDSNTITEVDTLGSWINGTTNQIDVADETDGTVTLSIPFSSSMASRITINENDVSDLQIDSGSFSSRISQNESDISDLYIASGSFSTRVTTNENDISNLQTYSSSLSQYLQDLTDSEVQQLLNINSVSISNTQWEYLGSLNQNLTTTSNVEFNNITGSNARFTGTLYGANIGSGVDNSVLILDSDGYIKTDEIDSRVWGSSLVDGSGASNKLSYWTDSNTIAHVLDLTNFIAGTTNEINVTDDTDGTVTLSIPFSSSLSNRVTTNENDISNLQTYSSSLSSYLQDLTDSEVQQLMNINSVTISNTQWGYLGSLDQSLATTDDVEFANITGSNLQLTSMTDGSVLFMKAGGVGQDNSNLFWDDTNNRLGIGTMSPDYKLDVNGNINIDNSSAYKYAGYDALKLATKGDTVYDYSSTIIGRSAGDSVTDGTTERQTVVGYAAGYLNTGTRQTALGYYAGYENAGIRQTALGCFAGYSNTGTYQTALGYAAGYSNTGTYQTALGYAAGYLNTGNYQTALGYYAGYENAGDRVIGIGYEATRGNTATADDVVAIGYQAGKDNTDANQFIVKQANINAVPLIQGNFATGNVGIGTTSLTEKLTVNGNISASAYIYAPNIGTGTDNSVLILDSDDRIKTDEINPIVWDTSATFLSSSNGADNRLAIYTSPNAIEGDSNITWDGSTLSIQGKLEATEKSFVINKPEGGKLEYSVLESNEKAVYVRGELYKNKVIELPEEWKWLVDENTISCQLTSIGKFQPLYIDKIKNNKIYINIDKKLKFKHNIHCYYLVHAERKDIDKLNVNRE